MTMTATTDQWMQFYQQPLMDAHDHDHDHALPPNTTSPPPTMPSSESNSISSQLTPKGNVCKPIRRRSRASKRTPTTLLNANTTNFRALVQQFTGCPTTAMSTLGVHKGPITLNFQKEAVSTRFTITQKHQEQQQLPRQQLLQQQSGYSFDYVKSSGYSVSTSMDVSDGLLLDNDFSLSDLTMNAFPNDTFYKNEL
ncbi:hypothetical protein ACSQ67_020218 [Phaseolus vulgaris]